jgi:histidinol-phosphate/aromatic aminotransferase/cobyric acid decarboxylase-like protein
VIVVRTLSKSFSLAGMRLGYGVSQAANIEQLF